jgi:hypothetical protein
MHLILIRVTIKIKKCKNYGAGGSYLIEDGLNSELLCFSKFLKEISWSEMLHKGSLSRDILSIHSLLWFSELHKSIISDKEIRNC